VASGFFAFIPARKAGIKLIDKAGSFSYNLNYPAGRQAAGNNPEDARDRAALL
jgi:hypothetical protein